MRTDEIDRIKQAADLLTVIGHDTPLKKAATTGGGEWAGPCPFCGGRDRLRVQPDRGRWWCRQCSPDEHWQDVIAYVMQRDRVDFQEAVARLNGKGLAVDFQPAHITTPEPAAQADDWQRAAREVVTVCECALWADTPASRGALEWLHWRGLANDTLKAHHIGFNPQSRRIAGVWCESGVTLPYFAGDVLHAINVRRPASFLATHPQADKYRLISGSRRVLYGVAHLTGKPDIVITEGEFDAALIWQEAHDLCDVVTMGAAKALPADGWLLYLVSGQRFYIATDHDVAGDEASRKWLELLGKRAQRVNIPDAKDITAYWQRGGDVRAWVLGLLPATEHDAALIALLDEPGAHDDLTWPGRYAAAAIAAGLACFDAIGNDLGAQGWIDWADAH